MKICSKCKIEKNFSEFYKNKNKKDGLRSQCKDCQKQYHKEHREEKKEYMKQYREMHREEIKQQKKQYNEMHKEEIKQQKKQWHENNKEKTRQLKQEKFKNDINFKIAYYLRTRLYKALKRNQKSGSAVRDLGCSLDEFRKYFEPKFHVRKTGEQMVWENYGKKGWHIDHIIPLSSFDLSDRKQLLKACHYTNLQPLWAEENLKKNKHIGESDEFME
ncbi:hypothetical protein HYV49_05355 [Candidatus Pacearchaeota archaeon]|nr:hypothetical protein [Candidatus Pacearchaeota archaeon]